VGKGRRSKPGADAVMLVRRPEALQLRIAGATYREIGARLGVSPQTAYTDIQASLAELNAEKTKQAEQYRELELERLDRASLALWPKVIAGSERAVMAWAKLSERRAKLLGLDAPAKTEITGADGGPVQLEAVRRLDKLTVEELQTMRVLVEKIDP